MPVVVKRRGFALLAAVAVWVTACGGSSATGTPALSDDGTDGGRDGAAEDECAGNSDCDPTLEFCKKSTCDSSLGTCATRPGSRDTSYCMPGGEMVCGCDGVTYSYECIANFAGVNVASAGLCPPPPGGGGVCAVDADCPDERFYCKKPSCDSPEGVCETKPDGFTCASLGIAGGSLDTVCGCDHRGHSGECAAAAEGVNVDHTGECMLPEGPCESQDDCGGEAYAEVVYCRPESCDSPVGVCTPFPTSCPTISIPVCGCDGGSYPNDCFLGIAGAGLAYPGPCRSGEMVVCDTSAECPTDAVCIDDPRVDCGATATCPGVCVTSSGSWCGPYDYPNGDGVLGCLSGLCALGRDGCDAASELCGSCVYGGSATCDIDNPCPNDELCVPAQSCDRALTCPSLCVRP